MKPSVNQYQLLFALLLTPSILSAQTFFADGFESCDASCATELTCPTPQPGQACVAGRILDVQNSAPVCNAPSGTAVCTGIGPGGPCALALRVYDSLDYISNPIGATPIAASEMMIDGCGRFRISGLNVPAAGTALILIDDAFGAPELSTPAASVYPISSGLKLEQMHLYRVRHSTDKSWNTTAGSPFGGDTFGELGTHAAIFLHAGVPVEGVQLLSNGNAVVSSDYYFSDLNPLGRSTVDANLTETGPNGTALLVTTAMSTISGTGGEPEGCVWPLVLSGSAPGLVQVGEYRAVLEGAPSTICP